MNPTLAFQFQGFLISVGAGVLLAAFYDVFRIFRTVFHSVKRAVFFQDLFYMLCASFFTFLVALGVNYGEVRFYILAGEIIGWCLYYLTVGMITIRVFRFISSILHRFLIDPIKKILVKFFHWIIKKLKILGKKVKTAVINQKKRLKQHREIVYNHTIRKHKLKQNNSRKRKSRKKKAKPGLKRRY